MVKRGVIFFIVIVFVLIIVIVFFFQLKIKEGIGNSQNGLGDSQNADSGINNLNSEEGNNGGNDSIGVGAGGNSGGLAEGSNQVSNENSNCIEGQISYSIGRVRANFLCNQYENEICIDKKVDCSAELRNFEESISGIFKVQFIFYETDNRSNIFTSKNASVLLDSKQIKNINEILSLGITDANKNVSCDCITISVPLKNIC